MPIEPVKIPQNVYIEDRLFGPITLKQVLITGIGTGISYVLWATAQQIASAGAPEGTPAGVGLPLTILLWTPAAIFAIFAFVKINDLSMFRIVLLSLEKLKKPAERQWSPRQGVHVHIRTFRAEKEDPKKKRHEVSADTKLQRLEDITHALDAPLFATAVQQPTMHEEADPLERTISVVAGSAKLPVYKEKIVASPLENQGTIDGISPAQATQTSAPDTGSVSIFRDLSPRTSHG